MSLICNIDIREEASINSKDIIISCIDEFAPNKNHLFLLGAWNKITQDLNNMHLLFIGNGRYLEYLKQQAKKISL